MRKTIKILFLYKVEGISGTKRELFLIIISYFNLKFLDYTNSQVFSLRRLRIVTYHPMIVQFFFLNLHFKLFKIANNYMNILKTKLKRLVRLMFIINSTFYIDFNQTQFRFNGLKRG